MPLVLPLLEQIVAGQPRKPKPIHDSFQTIVDKFNANIVDADILSTANISGSKLADLSILTAKIADLQITTAKLASSTGAADGVTTIKIADLAVTSAKLAAGAVVPNIGAATILYGKLNIITTTVTFSSGTVSAGTANSYDLSSAAPAAGAAVTNTIANASIGLPLLVEVSRTAPAGGGAPNDNSMMALAHIHRDPVTNKYYLVIRNPEDAAGDNVFVTLNLLTVKIFYLSAV